LGANISEFISVANSVVDDVSVESEIGASGDFISLKDLLAQSSKMLAG
jgi:hypothetical protein